MSVINIKSLSWKPATEYILCNVNAELNLGKFYGIIGPNGSGKTSLMRHILRAIEPEKDSVHLNNIDILNFKRKDLAKEISWVPQNTSIDVSFNAFDIVMMGRTAHFKAFQSENSTDHKVVENAMRITNCLHLKKKSFSTLSGGEAQRVIAARAIAQDSKIIILDEPISHLDIRHQKDLMESMLTLNKTHNKTIIAVLHDLNMAVQYCDELFLLYEGNICAYGEPETILTDDNLYKVYGMEFHRLQHPTTNKLYLIPK